MISLIGDFHTHTIASQHAYSTVNEMITAAKAKGLKALAITDHGPEMLDGAIEHHFRCIMGLPEIVDEIHLFKGAETNIKNFDGKFDLSDDILRKLDFVFASYHIEAINSGTKEENTRGWINAIRSGLIDCIGHCGNPAFPFNHEEVVATCAMENVAIEINNNSFAIREGSEANCQDVINLALRYNVHLIINSDAHSMYSVGDFQGATRLLETMGLDTNCILNSSFEKTLAFIENRKKARRG